MKKTKKKGGSGNFMKQPGMVNDNFQQSTQPKVNSSRIKKIAENGMRKIIANGNQTCSRSGFAAGCIGAGIGMGTSAYTGAAMLPAAAAGCTMGVGTRRMINNDIKVIFKEAIEESPILNEIVLKIDKVLSSNYGTVDEHRKKTSTDEKLTMQRRHLYAKDKINENQSSLRNGARHVLTTGLAAGVGYAINPDKDFVSLAGASGLACGKIIHDDLIYIVKNTFENSPTLKLILEQINEMDKKIERDILDRKALEKEKRELNINNLFTKKFQQLQLKPVDRHQKRNIKV